jgi:putative Mn2+ efflux pump MntP
MVISSFKNEECPKEEASIKLTHMIPLAIATSIDALAAGVTLAFLRTNIVVAVLFIGVTTFALSVLGVRLGGLFGAKYKSKAELAGGIALILLALWSLF